MKSHAEVHLEIRRILFGTRLKSFMVTTNSWEHDDGDVSVEWSSCIHSGSDPIFFFRSRSADDLLEQVRAGIDKRRAEFAESLGELAALTGPAPLESP
jgi:hypothetical protein